MTVSSDGKQQGRYQGDVASVWLSQDASLGAQPRLHRGDKNALKRLNQSLRYELPSDDE